MPARNEPPDALVCDWCSELLPDDGTCHIVMGETAAHHRLMHASCCTWCNPSLPFDAEPSVRDVRLSGGHEYV